MNLPQDPGGRREEAGVPAHLRGLVSRLLRAGLLVGSVLMALGVLGFVADGVGLGPPDVAVGLREALGPSLLALDPRAFAYVGLLVLLATPLTRVGVSVALFAAAGDRAFTALTVLVLALLLTTVAVGVLW